MNNKEIVKLCKNYDKIVNFDVMDGDTITYKLIRIYQKYIFNIDIYNSDDVKEAIEIDRILGQYLDDYILRRELQKEVVKIKVRKDTKNMLKDIIDSIIKIFNNYQEYTTRVITISHWI